MSLVKSFAVGNGDMFYIQHGSFSDSFSIIDCCLPDSRRNQILNEIEVAKAGKTITRFISTHPDQDHIDGLVQLDDRIKILNYYVVKNAATKYDETDDFKRYKVLRDHPEKAFYIERGCSRLWMNKDNEERGQAGINVSWPIVANEEFKKALKQAENGGSPNNISPVIQYSLNQGARAMWMGDLETDFMESISDDFTPKKSHILFAPHHGRKSGRVPKKWLEAIDPTVIVVGEAPSSDLTYYGGYNTITQNSAGDITFECLTGKTHVYVSSQTYSVDFLNQERVGNTYGHYIGTFYV